MCDRAPFGAAPMRRASLVRARIVPAGRPSSNRGVRTKAQLRAYDQRMTGRLAAALLVLLIGAGCAAPGPSASAAGSRTEAPAPTTAPPAEESPAGVAAAGA